MSFWPMPIVLRKIRCAVRICGRAGNIVVGLIGPREFG